MERKSFILYVDVLRSIFKVLNNEQLGLLIKHITEYAETGESIAPDKFSPAFVLAFEIVKNHIDNNTESYEKIREKRRDAIRKRWDKTKESDTNNTNDTNVYKCIQEHTKDTNDTNGYLNDNVNVNVNENVNVNVSTKVDDNIKAKAFKSNKFDATRFVEFFNAEMERAKALIPRIQSVSEKRKTMVLARIREYGKESLVTVVQKAAASNFLNGRNQRAFIASFDWLIKPTNYPKVLEGNYDNVTPNGKPAATEPIGELIQNVGKERQQREKENEQRIRSLYEAAQQGDERAKAIIDEMRKNGVLKQYGLK